MAPLNTTRKLFEVRVGAYHTIEILLQIRQADIAWWNSDLRNHERQLHKLLGRRVLSVECRDEIEAFHARRKKREERKAGFVSEAQTDGKKKVVVGEDNLKKKAKSNKRDKASKDKKKKGDAKSQKKQKTADGKVAKGSDDAAKEKRSKHFQDPGTWIIASGYTIQLCYSVEDIEPTSATTLVFRPKKNIDVSKTEDTADGVEQSQTSVDDNDNKTVPLASFRKWTKLKKRINVWVFKLDPDNPCDLSHSEGGGFPRPDLLPMADIFRTIGDNE